MSPKFIPNSRKCQPFRGGFPCPGTRVELAVLAWWGCTWMGAGAQPTLRWPTVGWPHPLLPLQTLSERSWALPPSQQDVPEQVGDSSQHTLVFLPSPKVLLHCPLSAKLSPRGVCAGMGSGQEHSAFGELSSRDVPSELRVVSCSSGLPALPLADLEGGDTGCDHPFELSL